MPRIFPLLALTFAAATSLAAASFPCSAAHTPQEKSICADPTLSLLDEQLAAAYQRLRSELSPTAAAEVQSDQRDWLLWLNRICSPTSAYQGGMDSCLTSEYGTRLRQLTEGHVTVGGLVFYPRAHFVTATESSGNDRPPQDPGFSVFNFSWPQIDKPDDHAAAWNRAVLSRAQRLSSYSNTDAANAFNTSLENGGDREIFYHLRAANQRLIVVDLGNMSYSYGAAHPLTGIATFSWWLAEKRELTLADIFNSSTAWQTPVAAAITAKLRDTLNGFIDGDDRARKTIAETMNSIDAWTITSSGPVITFGQYAVASYAQGMPSAGFSWDELRPYLIPTLHPATLPQPIPQP